MPTPDELRSAKQSGRWMREAHKDRSAVPMFAMGEDGHQLRKAWQAGWDERDSEIKRGIAA